MIATEGDALLQDIIAHPERDDLRLIYADWCEDHGDTHRAEFIRVQVELALIGTDERKPCGGYYCETYGDGTVAHRDCNRVRLGRRERELMDAFSGVRDGDKSFSCLAAWARAVEFAIPHHPWEHVEFRRGFISQIRLPHDAWLEHGPALVRAHPLERVELSDKRPLRPVVSLVACWCTYVGHERFRLSPKIHGLLRGYFQAPENSPDWKDYPTEKEALDALSDALLMWARSAKPRRSP